MPTGRVRFNWKLTCSFCWFVFLTWCCIEIFNLLCKFLFFYFHNQVPDCMLPKIENTENINTGLHVFFCVLTTIDEGYLFVCYLMYDWNTEFEENSETAVWSSYTNLHVNSKKMHLNYVFNKGIQMLFFVQQSIDLLLFSVCIQKFIALKYNLLLHESAVDSRSRCLYFTGRKSDLFCARFEIELLTDRCQVSRQRSYRAATVSCLLFVRDVLLSYFFFSLFSAASVYGD